VALLSAMLKNRKCRKLRYVFDIGSFVMASMQDVDAAARGPYSGLLLGKRP
jgi:hypothetical protein